MPVRGFLSIARACNGMSGRLQASGAGDKSSVLVSPPTLNTVTVKLSGTSGRLVNHSPSAQLCRISLAYALPASDFSLTSWKASNINKVRSEEHTSELQSRGHLVCRLLLEKKKKNINKKQDIIPQYTTQVT